MQLGTQVVVVRGGVGRMEPHSKDLGSLAPMTLSLKRFPQPRFCNRQPSAESAVAFLCNPPSTGR